MSKVNLTRQQESELPALISMRFINQSTDYQQGVQYARRMSTHSAQQVNIDSAIVFGDTEAKAVVDKLMYDLWVARDTISFQLPRKYAFIDPTDIIVLSDAESSFYFTLRVSKKNESRNGAIELECVATHAPVYMQNSATSIGTVVPQGNTMSSGTIAYLLDLPVLRDHDEGVGYYIAMGGIAASWAGGAIYESFDDGATYSVIDTGTIPATIGVSSSLLPNSPETNTVDTVNTLDVIVNNGDLATITFDAMLNGGNLCALKSGDGWEVFQFQTAELLPTVGVDTRSRYRLSNFLRGRYGTEWAMAGHATSDAFVLLDARTIRRVPLSSAYIGIPLKYKIVTLGQMLGMPAPIVVTNKGVSLKPYSPSILGGGRNDALDVTLNWTRRTRIGGTWRDYVDVPLSEDSEIYDIEITDSTRAVVKRTIRVTDAESLVYTAAQQTTDFGSTQATVYFTVYQISSTIGRGYPAQGTI
jgi:hypothetical protein